MSSKSDLEKEWRQMKEQFAARTTELGAIEYKKQCAVMDLMKFELEMGFFWKKNKHVLAPGKPTNEPVP